MARYTDLDKIIAKLDADTTDPNEMFPIHWMKTWLNMQPTADVAPKSEVAREIFEEIDKRFAALLGFYPCDGEFEDAKHFVDFHWKYIKKSIMSDYDAELKKKYTEERTD